MVLAGMDALQCDPDDEIKAGHHPHQRGAKQSPKTRVSAVTMLPLLALFASTLTCCLGQSTLTPAPLFDLSDKRRAAGKYVKTELNVSGVGLKKFLLPLSCRLSGCVCRALLLEDAGIYLSKTPSESAVRIYICCTQAGS